VIGASICIGGTCELKDSEVDCAKLFVVVVADVLVDVVVMVVVVVDGVVGAVGPEVVDTVVVVVVGAVGVNTIDVGQEGISCNSGKSCGGILVDRGEDKGDGVPEPCVGIRTCKEPGDETDSGCENWENCGDIEVCEDCED